MAVTLYALSNVARSGATRCGYTSPKGFVSVNGVQYATARPVDANKVVDGTLTITESLHQTPNTATFSMQGAEPVQGQEVIVTLGSINNLNRQFAGVVLNRQHRYVGTPAAWTEDANCVDYTWFLTRRQFSGQYTSADPAVVAAAIVANVPGFTVQVEAGLPTLDTFSQTDVDCLTALTALATRCGAYVDVDYHKVVRIFTVDTSVTNPTSLTSGHVSLDAFAVTYDLSQVRTRIFVEGGGVNALTDVAAGSTSLPVDGTAWYNASGGTVKSGAQHITYTGFGPGWRADFGTLATEINNNTSGYMLSVAWSPTLGLFVALSGNLGGPIRTSADGQTWTTVATNGVGSVPNVAWNAVIWVPALALFVAVGSGACITSPDGSTWTSRTIPNDNFTALAYSSSLGLIVAVGAKSASHSVATSPDGSTWTSRTGAPDTTTWNAVAWAPALGLFAAYGSAVSGSNLMTSPDGITWTSRTTGVGGGNGIAWSPTLGLFVIMVGTATATSTDGTTWTAHTSATPTGGSGGWRVIWTDGGYFVACCAASETVNYIASLDGITWLQYSQPLTSQIWNGLCWSAELGRVVIVGGDAASATKCAIALNIWDSYPTLIGIPASGVGSILYAIKQGDAVNLLVQCDDTAAQTALAALIGGTDDGVVVDYLQDGSIGETEARARGNAQLALVSTTQVSIAYTSRDVNTHAGRTVTVSLGSPTSVSADFLIQHVTINAFAPALNPTYTVEASSQRFSLEDLLRVLRQQVAA